jgi:hypothetical protein
MSVYTRQPFKGTSDAAASQTIIYVALGETYPTAQTVTLGAEIAAAATTATVTALTVAIPSGTYLVFETADKVQRMVKVTADAAIGATALTIAANSRTVATASTAEFPGRIWDRSNVDIDQSASSETVNTFESGASGIRVAGSIERSVSIPGFWRPHDNGGYKMCEEAFAAGNALNFGVRYPAPAGATKGIEKRFKGIITSMPIANDAAGLIAGDIEIEVSGAVTEVAETWA